MRRADSLEKTLMLGKIEGEKRGTTENEMVGWHHLLNGYEFEQALRVCGGQRSLACCRSWGRKESDMTDEQQHYLLGSKELLMDQLEQSYST